MKNLNKVLSVLLAGAMATSLLGTAIAADADFKDASEISNTEAVSILSTLGIINGQDDGNFNPQGKVTRGEMAKMITIATLGDDVDVTAFSNLKTGLTDNTNWAKAYVNYCYSQGVIAGKGNNTFAPTANVTAAEAAKMLLVAIGYNAEVQGYTGEKWMVNTVRDAQLTGLFKGLSVKAEQELTRDEAAQMIYNAVNALLIEKNPTLNINTGSVSYYYEKNSNNETLLTEVFNVVTWEGILDQFSYDSDKEQWTYEIEANGLNLTQDHNYNGITTSGGSDQANFDIDADYTDLFMNRVKVLYTLDKNDDLEAVYGVFTTKTSVVAEGVVGDITAPGGSDKKVKIDGTNYNLTSAASSVNIYEFGNNNASDVSVSDTLDDIGTYATSQKRELTYSFKLIDNTGDGKGDLLLTYPTSIEKVSYVGSKSFTTARGDNAANDLSNGVGSVKFEDVSVYDGLAKGDFVLVTEAANSPKNIETFTKLDVQNGTISSVKKSDGLAKLDNVWYSTDMYSAGTFNAGDKLDYILVNGYIVYQDGTASVSVDDLAILVKQAGSSNGIDSTYTSKLLKADGTTVVVEATTTGTVGNMYKISTNSNGYTVLDNANVDNVTTANTGFDVVNTAKTGQAVDSSATNITASVTWAAKSGSTPAKMTFGSPAADYFINDDAVVFVFDGTDYSVTTGAKLKNTSTSISKVNFVAAKKNSSTGYTNVAVAYVTTASAISTSKTYGYVTADVQKFNPETGKFYTEVTFWDGTAEKTLKTKTMADSGVVATAYTLIKGSMFEYTLNADGDIETLTAYTPAAMAASSATSAGSIETAAVTAYADNMLTVTNDYFASAGTKTGSTDVRVLTVTDDTEIFYVDNGDVEGAEDGIIKLADSDTVSGQTSNFANVQLVIDGSDNVVLMVVDTQNDSLCLK